MTASADQSLKCDKCGHATSLHRSTVDGRYTCAHESHVYSGDSCKLPSTD